MAQRSSTMALPYGSFRVGGEPARLGVLARRTHRRPRRAQPRRSRARSGRRPSRAEAQRLPGRRARAAGPSVRAALVDLLDPPTETRSPATWYRWPRRRWSWHGTWPTTSTSTPRSTTPPTSGGSSGPTARRCCRTGGTCRSATTAGPAPSWCRARRSCGRAGSARPRPTRRPTFGAVACGSTSRPRSASSSAAGSSARRRPWPPSLRRRTSSAWCCVNDWSARDIQAWEYVPLGPFLGKSFATSISAWVTPLAALDAARVAAAGAGPAAAALPASIRRPWALDLELEVDAQRHAWSAAPPFRTMYWTPGQQLAHLTVNGASLRTGDLFASGTVSGPERGRAGVAARAVVERGRAGRAGRRHHPHVPRGRRRRSPSQRRLPTAPVAPIALGPVTGRIAPAVT